MQIGTGVTSVLHVHRKSVAADRVCLPFDCGAAQRLRYKVSSCLLFEHHQRSASFLDLGLNSRSSSSLRVAYLLQTIAHCPRRPFISITMCQHIPIDKVAVPCMFDVEGILTMPASISETEHASVPQLIATSSGSWTSLSLLSRAR
jgi:hypothetical protein